MKKTTTVEIIAENARDIYHDTIYSAILPDDVARADEYTNEHLSLTVEVMDALGIFHASNRMLVAIAEAMQAEAQHEPAAAYVIAVCDDFGSVIEEERYSTEAERAEAERYFAADGYEYVNAETVDEDGTLVHIDYYGQPRDPEPYQRHELEAFLGDYLADYDIDAIEDEATEYDPATGRRYWTPEAASDLWSICERHELVSYYPTAI